MGGHFDGGRGPPSLGRGSRLLGWRRYRRGTNLEDTLKITIYIPTPGSVLAAALEPGSVVMPISGPRSDGVRAVCWESRGFAERMPSTFADRAERAYARSRDQRNEQRRRVDGGDLRPIGLLDTLTGEVEIDSEQDADTLADWLGAVELDRTELTTTRGVVVQMYRELVRDHGALRPKEETRLMLRAAGGGGRSGWHSV